MIYCTNLESKCFKFNLSWAKANTSTVRYVYFKNGCKKYMIKYSKSSNIFLIYWILIKSVFQIKLLRKNWLKYIFYNHFLGPIGFFPNINHPHMAPFNNLTPSNFNFQAWQNLPSNCRKFFILSWL